LVSSVARGSTSAEITSILRRVDFAGYLVATAYNLVRLAWLTTMPALA
jgi:hypothetical protein